MTTRFAVLVLALAMLGVPLAAQPGPGPGRGPGPRYDKATEMTIEGTVKEVRYPDDGRGRKGLHLTVAAGQDSWDVHLGPASWIESKGFSFAAGDVLTILGSKVEVEGKPVLIARRITKGDSKLELRDEQGRPLWAGSQS